MLRIRPLLFAAGIATLLTASANAQRQTVKVFILAGQSNMEGKAQNVLWDHQAVADDTRAFFAPFRDQPNEHWITRDDVFVKFLERRGALTIGYGSPNRTGPEFAFGCRVGDAIEEPVLLIKTAWGGRSIQKDFRPPSAGMPSDEVLRTELQQAQDRVAKRNEKDERNDALPTMDDIKAPYGRDYRNMIAEVETTLADCGKLFPQLAGHRPQLCGFVWFQGWNDQYGGAELDYAQNLHHLINDVRKDLGVKDLPIVIGVMGQNGKDVAKGAMLAIQQAQLAVADLPELRDSVRAVRTDVLVDEAAWQLYPTWQENKEQWQRTGSDHAYHYLGSAIWFSRIGYAMADAMLLLQAGR